ncbi:hypothetical protein FB382_002867 [Nocardioides ginsengisegetis]|uniref:Uncharacterized protein n=1 Tax=Nocardioides ginsengisegetis TaxID=661491 RepID=A0A7W3J1I2_9ACTN|nr:hypothetical protein [Nocardioides ginsengisegetis]MBA8804576.1 hypothetical protein [Nocardioides ginsengisegetis]
MRWLVRLGVGLAVVVVAAVLTLALRQDPTEATGVVNGPVVAVSIPGAPYPLATVRGNLILRGECLMLGNSVVFWPAGTSWDSTSQSVLFSGDFDGSVSVGSHFVGGGGFYNPDDFLRGLGEAGDALRDCGTATGARSLVLAYPKLPR